MSIFALEQTPQQICLNKEKNRKRKPDLSPNCTGKYVSQLLNLRLGWGGRKMISFETELLKEWGELQKCFTSKLCVFNVSLFPLFK